MPDVIQTGRSQPVYGSPPQVALVNNYRTKLRDGLAADQCVAVVCETAGLPRLYNDSILFLTIKRLSDGLTEQVKVTSIAGPSLQVERGIGGEAIDFYPGDVIYSALTAEILNQLVTSVRTVNVHLCNLLDLSHIPPATGCDVNSGDEVEYTGLPFPINADQALTYLTEYVKILWKHVDCGRATFDTFKAKDYAQLWTTVCDLRASLERLRDRVDDLDERFTAVECCCDRLESRLSALEARVDSLEDRVDELERCVDELKNAPPPDIPTTCTGVGSGSDGSDEIEVPDGCTVLVTINSPGGQCGTSGCTIGLRADFTQNGNTNTIAQVVGDNGSDGFAAGGFDQGSAVGPGTLQFISLNVLSGVSVSWSYTFG